MVSRTLLKLNKVTTGLLLALAVAAAAVPASLLGVALRENHQAIVQFGDVNRSGSLRARSLQLYALGSRGEDSRPDFAEMAAVRQSLRGRYPEEVARTDAAWAALAAEEARTGRVRWNTAEAMRRAADMQTRAIEARAGQGSAIASHLLQAGLVGILGSLAAMLLLLGGLARAEARRRSLQASLEDSQALFLAALNSMRDGFAVQDPVGVVLMCNNGADRLLHLPAGTFAGRPLTSHGWRFCREDGTDFPREQHPSRLALATGEVQPETVVGVLRDDAPVQWLAICAAPLRHPGEEQPYAAVQTFADVTARIEAEAAGRLAGERLRRLHTLSTDRDLTLSDKMDALMRLGCDCLYLPAGMLSRLSDEQFEVLYAVSGENLPAAGEVCGMKDTYCARVLEAERPLAQEHIGETDWREIPLYATLGLESYIGAPLRVNGCIYGTLCFYSHAPREISFTEADLDFVCLMAQWAEGELTREEAREQIESYNIVLEFQMQELEKANAELEALATQDGLTGIKNRRAFGMRLEEEVARATRYSLPLALLLLDVDNFKSYNDTFGHPAGDEVLKIVAQILEQNARETDLAARYGGEEFVVLLPQTDAAGAWVIAERIRRAVADYPWLDRAVTLSIGVAHLLPVVDTGSELIARADQALYQSKAGGRNRVSAMEEIDYRRMAGSGVRSGDI